MHTYLPCSKHCLLTFSKSHQRVKRGHLATLPLWMYVPFGGGLTSPRLLSSLQTTLLTLCYLAQVITAYRGEDAAFTFHQRDGT